MSELRPSGVTRRAEGFCVRPAVPEDASAWVEAHVATQIATYAPLMPPSYAQDRQGMIVEATMAVDRELRRTAEDLAAGREPFRRYWVAEDGRSGHSRPVIGIASSGSEPDWWEEGFDPPPAGVECVLDRLYVVPHAHGSGVGQALFDAAVGSRPAYLWILVGNPRAERFYRRNGFLPDGSTGSAGRSWHDRPMFRMVRRE